jgi:glyoxylase-like metal-dependent hydrolase (beta-lactamase superfamily II)
MDSTFAHGSAKRAILRERHHHRISMIHFQHRFELQSTSPLDERPARTGWKETEEPMYRRIACFVALAALFAAIASPAIAQEATPAAPTDQVIPLAENVYAFSSGNYVSLIIVTDEGVIATDPSSQFDTDRAIRLEAAIAELTDQPVRYLVYSHSHADHATGGGVFSDTATFVSHANAVDKIAELGDPNTPVPAISFDSTMTIELGGTTVELIYTGRNHSDNSLVVFLPAERILYAVDFIPVDTLPFQDLPDFYPEEWIESLTWIDEQLDFDTLVTGHPPETGTKADVVEIRTYAQDLTAAVEEARAQGMADNSPEMIEHVRAALEPAYGAWGNFAEWLPLNIEGLIRIWSAQEAAPEASPSPQA